MEGQMKFRVKMFHFKEVSKNKIEDFEDVMNALNFIDTEWDLNSHLYNLLLDGFIQSDDGERFVMLTGVWPNGTENMVCHSSVACQMGSPLPPMMRMIHKVVRHDG